MSGETCMPGQWLEEQLDGEHGKEGGRAPYLGLSTIAEAFGWAHAQEWGGERVVSNKETNSQQNTLQKKNRELVISGMYLGGKSNQPTIRKKKILRGCRLTPLFQLQKVPALWNTSFSCAYIHAPHHHPFGSIFRHTPHYFRRCAPPPPRASVFRGCLP
jgi:hypothetical protein